MSRIKVLPVYPKFPDTFWSFKYALPYIGKKAIMPPLGLLTVLSMLPENEFESRKVVDLNTEPLTDEQIENSDIVFTSTMLLQGPSHDEVIKRAHALGKKVVAGGPLPTSYPEKNSEADFIIAGEAEITLPPFLEDLVNGSTRKIYTEDDFSHTGRAKLTRTGKPDITQTPIPKWSLIDLSRYANVPIQYSRGCPFDCEFCDITSLYGRESRTKTPQQMILELNALYNTGYRGAVFIVDDNFIGNRKNVKNLLPELITWQKSMGHPFSFHTEVSMNLAWDVNRDILEGMVEAGFNEVFLGIESIDREVLETMKKGQNTKMSQDKAVRTIQQAGLEVTGGFILGADGEKPGSSKRLFEFIQDAGVVTAMPGLLVAIKGTRLYNRLEKEERLKGDASGNNTHKLSVNYKPEQDEAELITDYKELLQRLADPKNYFERCRVLQQNLKPNSSGRGVNLEGILALGRYLTRMPFIKGSFQAAKYLAETLMHKPSYFPEAVAQAIKQIHFGRITDATLQADAYIPHAEKIRERFQNKAREIYESSKGSIEDRLAKISSYAGRVLTRAEKKCYKLHKDFREGAEQALDNLRETIFEIINNYRETSAVPVRI